MEPAIYYLVFVVRFCLNLDGQNARMWDVSLKHG